MADFQIPKRQKTSHKLQEVELPPEKFQEVYNNLEDYQRDLVDDTHPNLKNVCASSIANINENFEERIKLIKEKQQAETLRYKEELVETYCILKAKIKHAIEHKQDRGYIYLHDRSIHGEKSKYLRDSTVYEQNWIKYNRGQYDAVQIVLKELTEKDYTCLLYPGEEKEDEKCMVLACRLVDDQSFF